MTLVIAHRGDHAAHPENTLAAFRAAQVRSADGIEMDVHYSADGTLVIHHDYYLKNTGGENRRIDRQNTPYIQTRRVGAEKIPTLPQVFEALGNSVRYELELKGFTEPFLKNVITTIRHYRLEVFVECTSPHAYVLSRLRELSPGLRTGMFVAPFPDWMDVDLGRTLVIHNALLGRVNVLHCPLTMCDDAFVAAAHHNGLRVHAADCNTAEALQTAYALKVDQLSTDNLALALATRDTYPSNSS